MHCPFCLSANITVLDSRDSENGVAIRRRRSCEVCHRRFTTYERVEMRLPKIVKRDGMREEFDGMKVRRSMEIALRKRQVLPDEVDKSVNAVMQKVMGVEEKEVSSKQVGRWIKQALYQLDAVAFVRYASVYENFSSVEDFSTALQSYFNDEQTLPSMEPLAKRDGKPVLE